MTASVPGKLTYVEGQMYRASQNPGDPNRMLKACWLANDDGDAICVVTEGADFDKSSAALKHAADATQRLPDLLAACEHLLFANKLFSEPDHKHNPDTEWEKAMDMAESAIASARNALRQQEGA